MKKFGDFWQVLKNRWRNHMPKFFARMMWICGLISGTALAANEAMQMADIEPHQWWIDIRAYLIAVPAGAMFACKFTQEYDKNGQPIDARGQVPGSTNSQKESARDLSPDIKEE